MRRHIAKHRKSFQLLNVEDGRGRTLYVLAWRREVMQMDIDAKIVRVKELIAKREELDAELQELLGELLERGARQSVRYAASRVTEQVRVRQNRPRPLNELESPLRRAFFFFT
jgi:hypothetical protein